MQGAPGNQGEPGPAGETGDEVSPLPMPAMSSVYACQPSPLPNYHYCFSTGCSRCRWSSWRTGKQGHCCWAPHRQELVPCGGEGGLGV